MHRSEAPPWNCRTAPSGAFSRWKDNGTSYEAVAGLRSKRLAFNAEPIDVTDAGSAGRWRELPGAAGAISFEAL